MVSKVGRAVFFAARRISLIFDRRIFLYLPMRCIVSLSICLMKFLSADCGSFFTQISKRFLLLSDKSNSVFRKAFLFVGGRVLNFS